LVFAALLGEPRVEGFSRLNPTDVGRLIGLDRAPEVKTLRSRIGELAETGRSSDLIEHLARTHIAAHTEATGVFYVDGHVRAYHSTAVIPKHHVARIRIAMPAEEDIWVADANGDGLLVWQADPGDSLVGALARAVNELRDMVGPDARPTIAFDRGGWSPKLFTALTENHNVDILTYRKGKSAPLPRSAFKPHTLVDTHGRQHHYLLSDRRVRVRWKDTKPVRDRRFDCRQITRLDPDTGHQTQIVTTRTDRDPAFVAHAMFSRWRQENFFRYMRAHYGLDALDAYETTNDNPDRLVPNPARLVPNPARRTADKHYEAAQKQLTAAHINEGQATFDDGRDRATTKMLAEAHTAAVAELDVTRKAIPTKIRVGDLRPEAARLDPERKRIHDAVRTATYNAESALARTLTPHYPAPTTKPAASSTKSPTPPPTSKSSEPNSTSPSTPSPPAPNPSPPSPPSPQHHHHHLPRNHPHPPLPQPPPPLNHATTHPAYIRSPGLREHTPFPDINTTRISCHTAPSCKSLDRQHQYSLTT